VTGATGFTGRRVVSALAGAGHSVTAFVRETSDFGVVGALGVPARVGDLADARTLRRALEGQDVLVNVASLGTGLAPGIVHAAREAGIRRSVFFSTSAVRTAIATPSRDVRLAAERTVREGGVGATLLRPTMIYGAPGDRNVERLIRFVARSPVVPVPGSGRGLQQPVHVEDLASATAAVVAHDDLAGRDLDLAGPASFSFVEMVLTVARALGKRRLVLHVPSLVARGGAALAGLVRGRRVVSGEQIRRLDEDKSVSIAAAAAAIGYAPRPFERGVREEAAALGIPGAPA
jgi:uncharacterized protein YbjT (DUF2867 family)